MNNLAKSEKQRYMSAADASCRYGMDYNEICTLCKEGKEFKCIKARGAGANRGGMWKIDVESFEAFYKEKIANDRVRFEMEVERHQNLSHDPVNHPSHYTQNKFESIDEMMIVFGPEAVYNFCICNAWKYKNRASYKGNFEEDMKKADWYLTKAKEIKGGNLWQE